MKTILLSLVCIAAVAAFPMTADAGRPKVKKQQYTPPPTPTPPPAPSVDLSKFAAANLERILGPLEPKMPMPQAELTQIRNSISARFSKATLAERPEYQTALGVCDALSQAMSERNTASLNPAAAAGWPQRSAQLRANIQQLMAQQKASEVPATPTH